mgnify:FL=1
MINVALYEEKEEFLRQLDEEKFRQFYLYANTKLHNPQLDEDAVQDTFLIAYIKIADLMASNNPKGWLMNTLKNTLRNVIRKRGSTKSYVFLSIEQDNVNIKSEDEISFETLYSGTVSDEDLYLLKRAVIDQSSCLELADELGISLEACKKRVQRAKTKFRKQLPKD